MRRDALVMSGMLLPDTGAEQLEAATGAGALDHRRGHPRPVAELLGNRGGKREHG